MIDIAELRRQLDQGMAGMLTVPMRELLDRLKQLEAHAARMTKAADSYAHDLNETGKKLEQLEAENQIQAQWMDTARADMRAYEVKLKQYERALRKARDKLLAFIMREYGSGGEPDEGTPDHPLEAVCQMMSEALAQDDSAKEEKGK